MINEFITNFNICKDAKSAIEYMVSLKKQNPSLKYKDKNGAYVFENYYILPGYTNKNSEFLKSLKENLNIVQPICKTSAPELIDIVSTEDENFSAIIYKINDTKNADLIPYLESDGANQEKTDLFISEQIELLNKTGLYNPEIFNSTEHFYLTPDTKNIVFEAWGELVKINKDEKENLLHKLKCLL